jgi:hypothetical protein
MDLDERVTRRIAELQSEFAAGEGRLAKLDAERAHLRETLLRIEGAVLALSELQEPADAEAPLQPAEPLRRTG